LTSVSDAKNDSLRATGSAPAFSGKNAANPASNAMQSRVILSSP